MKPSGNPARENESAATDEQIMEYLQRRHQEALAELYQRYHSTMKSIIMQILHNDAEADDLLDEVIDEIWQRANDFSPELGRPLPWIMTITRRRAIDRLRKRKAYMRTKDRFRIESEQAAGVWNQRSALKEVILSDERCFLDHVMETLPEPQRQVLVLIYFQGMSQREAARETDIPLGTIKTRIELGLNKMSAAMAGHRDKIR
jgi:RNA polymerase sigma-70 factor (ECF subfamily)